MRARDLVFHVGCFRCILCNIHLSAGDTAAVRGGRVFCSEHYDGDVLRYIHNGCLLCFPFHHSQFICVLAQCGDKSLEPFFSHFFVFFRFHCFSYNSSSIRLSHACRHIDFPCFFSSPAFYINFNHLLVHFMYIVHCKYFEQNIQFFFFYCSESNSLSPPFFTNNNGMGQKGRPRKRKLMINQHQTDALNLGTAMQMGT